ncbi:MAG: hypothetical protein ACOYT9_03245 [Patescibacteria group bacterium]|jgi:ASC-1-like (ASCH) protein
MDHLAIMKPSLRLIAKILTGEKYIESRWYKHRRAPWGKVCVGDRIFFKDAGKVVTATARVSKVIQLQVNSPEEALKYAKTYQKGICLSPEATSSNTQWLIGKKYIILLYLNDARPITPFPINKSGYGNACAWITCESVTQLTENATPRPLSKRHG